MNRRLLFIIGLVVLFAVVVMVWFFMYAKPVISPNINTTKDPLAIKEPKKFFQFYNRDQTVESTSTTEVTEATPQALLEIWKQPAIGQQFITINTLEETTGTTTQGTSTIVVKKMTQATSSVLLFVDRATGYIYGHHVPTGKTYQVSNTVIPGIQDAYIFNNGKRVIMRYLDVNKKTITSVMATIPTVNPTSSALSLTDITYLPSNITSIAVSKKTTAVSYLVTTNNGSSVYTITTGGAFLVSTSPFREWALGYGGETLYATTKPSAYIEGMTVAVPGYEFLIGSKTGLMTNPGENGLFLNSMWSSRGLVTFFSTPPSQTVLSIKTLAQKCSWGTGKFLVCAIPKNLPKSEEGLPDDWFQGRFFFNDSLSIVNSNDGIAYPLYSFDDDIIFDIKNISISSSNDLISFNRKQNGSLWLLNTNFITTESDQ